MTDNAPRNKAIVREFLTKTFSDRDFTALERWLSPDYIQHNPFIPATRAGLRALVEKYPEGRHYEPGMIIIAEGDLVWHMVAIQAAGARRLLPRTFFDSRAILSLNIGTSCRKKCRRKKQWPATPCLRGRNVSSALT